MRGRGRSRRGHAGTPNRGGRAGNPGGSATNETGKRSAQASQKQITSSSALSLENTLSVSRSGGLVKDGDT